MPRRLSIERCGSVGCMEELRVYALLVQRLDEAQQRIVLSGSEREILRDLESGDWLAAWSPWTASVIC